jgi:hypothetical protein
MSLRSSDGPLAWVATALAAIALVLVIVNSALFVSNQGAQTDITSRQQFINQSVQLAKVQETFGRDLATVAARGDDKVHELLNQLGITYTVSQPPATGK